MKYCSTCGAELHDNDAFCPKCGARLDHCMPDYQVNNILRQTNRG